MRQNERTPDAGGVEGSGDVSSLAANDSIRDNQARTEKQVATLIPHWRGGKAGYLYDVQYAGELVVTGSREPEQDAARALSAKGVTGLVEIADANTGTRRTIVNVNVAVAARYCISEGERDGLRRRLWKPYQGRAVPPYSPEDGEGGP